MIERIKQNPWITAKRETSRHGQPALPHPLSPLAPQPLSPYSAPAFTLIELLVTISIIVLLVGLVVVGASQMRGSAKVDQTNVALGQLASALTEYKAKTGGTVPQIKTPPTPDNKDARNDVTPFVEAVRNQGGSAAKMLNSVPGALLEDPGVGNQVRDAWGTLIRYYDNEGRTNSDDLGDGLPPRPQPYFASAGPDQAWGQFSVSGNGELVRNKAAKDNIYSFNTGR